MVPERPLWKRPVIEGLLAIARFLEWDFKRLDRCKMRNLKRRDDVIECLARLTSYDEVMK